MKRVELIGVLRRFSTYIRVRIYVIRFTRLILFITSLDQQTMERLQVTLGTYRHINDHGHVN